MNKQNSSQTQNRSVVTGGEEGRQEDGERKGVRHAVTGREALGGEHTHTQRNYQAVHVGFM